MIVFILVRLRFNVGSEAMLIDNDRIDRRINVWIVEKKWFELGVVFIGKESGGVWIYVLVVSLLWLCIDVCILFFVGLLD